MKVFVVWWVVQLSRSLLVEPKTLWVLDMPLILLSCLVGPSGAVQTVSSKRAVCHYFGRAECVRCPWLLAETKVATIFDNFSTFSYPPESSSHILLNLVVLGTTVAKMA